MPVSPTSILFICKGNICRSPFAEHLANKITFDESFENMVFSSAGLEVPVSISSPREVLTVAEKFGVKINAHKSRVITYDLAESYDMIIAMESWQVMRLREMFPDYSDKIYLLPLFQINKKRWWWSYRLHNIADPYGNTLPYYYECFRRIERCIRDLLLHYNIK